MKLPRKYVLILLFIASCALMLLAANMCWTPSFARSQVVGWWWVDKLALNSSPKLASQQPSQHQAYMQNTSTTLSQKLRLLMLNLKTNFINEATGKVDYQSISKSHEFADYAELAEKLKYIDLSTLSVNEKKAFFINVYNALVIHGIVAKSSHLGFYGSLISRLHFFAETSYDIGHRLYSLNEIENGILRGNKASPVPLTGKPFRDDDSVLEHVLDCDARIHFALNCGAVSCPPIAFYSPDQLDKELDMATASYLVNTAVFDLQSRTLHLPKLFDWYHDDFGKDVYEIYRFVIKHIQASKPEMAADMLITTRRKAKYFVQYQDYDWSLNA